MEIMHVLSFVPDIDLLSCGFMHHRNYVDDGYPVVAELVPNTPPPQSGTIMVKRPASCDTSFDSSCLSMQRAHNDI